MSQLILTPEEDAIVADAIRAKATAYTAMFGVQDGALEALLAKIEGQLPAPVVVVVPEPVAEVIEAPKAKKARAVEEPVVAEEAKDE